MMPGLVVNQSSPRKHAATALETARDRLRACLEGIMGQALAWHEKPDGIGAPHSAIRITVGTGKSEAIRKMIARFVPEAKGRGLPHRVLFLVPTHRLADEARGRMPGSITAALWQGRNGSKVGTEDPMCRNLDAVEAALKIGADVEETACKRGDTKCPFYDACEYQKQKAPARAADVVFAAHEIGFQPPKAVGDGFGLIVIDEAFWQDGITDARLVISGMAHELQAFPVRDHDGKALDDETAHLRELIERVQTALNKMPDGYVTRAPLIEADLIASTPYEDGSCAIARRLEWKRKVDAGLRPGATADDRQRAISQFGFIAQLPRRAAMWKALDELLKGNDEATGRLRLETVTTKEGTVRWLRVIGRDDLDETLAGLPLIHADATMPFEVVNHYLPRLEMKLDLDVEAPHEHVTQIVGLPVGKASLQALAPGQRRDGEEDRVSRKRQRLVDAVRHLSRGRRTLVITYQAVEADFSGIENVETAHYNAIEGIDRWKDVDVVVTIGRPLPRPQDIERMAAAVTGKPVTVGDMAERGRAIKLKAGAEHVLKGRVYELPEAELIRQAVAEAAMVQAIGRARGVNRTASNPVEVYAVLHDTVTELPVDEVVEFGAIEPDAIDEMIARGLVPQFGADAAKLYPDLFPTAAAARQAYRRAHLNVERAVYSVTGPYREVPIRASHTVRVRYQPKGRSQHLRLALVDPSKVPDAKAALEAAIGELVLFEVLAEVETAPEAISESAAAGGVSEARPCPEKRISDVPTASPVRLEGGPRLKTRREYQPDLFGAEVVDLDMHKGKLTPELSGKVRREYEARGLSQQQFATAIGLSQAQACNVLKGRFGLSPEAAERLRDWMRA